MFNSSRIYCTLITLQAALYWPLSTAHCLLNEIKLKMKARCCENITLQFHELRFPNVSEAAQNKRIPGKTRATCGSMSTQSVTDERSNIRTSAPYVMGDTKMFFLDGAFWITVNWSITLGLFTLSFTFKFYLVLYYWCKWEQRNTVVHASCLWSVSFWADLSLNSARTIYCKKKKTLFTLLCTALSQGKWQIALLVLQWM